MARDSGGTYTSPIPPFVSGTTIRTDKMNPKFADISDALTDSLSRTGMGGMLAAMYVPNGSNAAPSYSFTNNPSMGLWYSGSDQMTLTAQAAPLQVWGLTQTSINRPMVLSATITNGTALTATGNGTGKGAVLRGGDGVGSAPGAVGTQTAGGAGATSGAGGAGLVSTGGASTGTGDAGTGAIITGGIVGSGIGGVGAVVTGTGNKEGVVATGGPTNGGGIIARGIGAGSGCVATSDNGAGVYATGGGGLPGMEAVGGSANGPGIRAFGGSGGTGVGIRAYNGTNGTGGAPRIAAEMVNGGVQFSGIQPDRDRPIQNILHAPLITKAWVRMTYNSGPSPTISVFDGCNIASVAFTNAGGTNGRVTITFAAPFANASYAWHCQLTRTGFSRWFGFEYFMSPTAFIVEYSVFSTPGYGYQVCDFTNATVLNGGNAPYEVNTFVSSLTFTGRQ